MLPTDLRPEETEIVFDNSHDVHVYVDNGDTCFDPLVMTGGTYNKEELDLLISSLEFVIGKFHESIEYIRSKQNNL